MAMNRANNPIRGLNIKSAPPVNTTATLKRLWHYIGNERGRLFVVILLAAMAAGLSLIGPFLTGRAIDRFIIPGDMNGLLRVCLILLLAYVAGSLVSWLQVYILADVAQRTVWQLRKDLFAHLQELPLGYFVSRSHGELMSRTTNDVENVSVTLNQSMIQLVTSTISIVGALSMMLYLNVWLTIAALLNIPLLLYITRKIAGQTGRQFKEQQKRLGSLNGYIEETISGQKVVKLFNREHKASEQFQVLNQELRQTGTRAQIYSGLMGPVMNVLGHTGYLLIAAIGGWMALHDLTSVGIIVSFLTYSRQFSWPLNDLANQYNLIQAGVAGAERVFEIMDTSTEYSDETQHLDNTPSIDGIVEFRNVSFHYQEENPILTNISFKANQGETIALVGPTGAGKTTVINLLSRFFDSLQGEILIDGKDIRTWQKNVLRSQIGVVLQDAHLFTGTVWENIRYGRLDATNAEVEAAARLADVDGFIRVLPEGYNTHLTREGGNISHGQRQLLTIARALLANPALLILDEATSSVDTLTEITIQHAMKTLMQGRTCFVIAHRLSTIRHADLILVLDNGKIIERGTHAELLKQKGFYYNLHQTQFEEMDEAYIS